MQNAVKPFKNLIDVTTYFANPATCKEYLEAIRWNGKIVCPHCATDSKIYRLKSGYKCGECRKPFSVTKGTIFENSPIPLQKWFVAIYIITSHKKGISSLQLSRDLSITQKSAWFMLQRIRYTFQAGSFEFMGNIVEADETYVGGKNKNRHADKKVEGSQGRSSKDKTPVFGLVERNGRVVAMKVTDTKMKTIQPIIHSHVMPGANLMTDEFNSYNGLGKTFNHQRVNHGNGIYVTGLAHTNTMEGFWSLLKRGIIGIYHSVSAKHLDRYVDEFEFRYNTREMAEAQRFEKMVSLSNGRLTYKELIN